MIKDVSVKCRSSLCGKMGCADFAAGEREVSSGKSG